MICAKGWIENLFFTITGGDPILHPDFWKVLEFLRTRKIPFGILGNPFHLDDEVCRRLASYGCRFYQLSLDGLEETHDYFRKKGSFEITLSKIEPLKKAGIHANIMTTVSKTNIDEIPPALLLTGIRGVGKTALLNKIKNDLKKDYLIIYLDLSSSNNYQEDKLSRMAFMQLFYKRIIESCKEYGLKTIDKQIESWFKTHNISLKNIFNIDGVPVPIVGFEEDYTKLADFVMNLPRKIYEKYSDEMDGILIFIDEFQLIKDLDDETNGFLWYLRSFIQTEKNVSYTFTGSMSMEDSLLGEINGAKGAFGGRMLTYQIEPFSYETTKRYLIERASHLEFSDDGFERFYKCTRGIPFYINAFVRFLMPGEMLDEKRVSEEFANVLPFLAINLINDWKNLSKQEQKIITTLLDEPLRRVDIANKLDVTSGGIGGSLNNLLNNGLIKYEKSRYLVSDNILIAWLKGEYDRKGVYPYRDF